MVNWRCTMKQDVIWSETYSPQAVNVADVTACEPPLGWINFSPRINNHPRWDIHLLASLDGPAMITVQMNRVLYLINASTTCTWHSLNFSSCTGPIWQQYLHWKHSMDLGTRQLTYSVSFDSRIVAYRPSAVKPGNLLIPCCHDSRQQHWIVCYEDGAPLEDLLWTCINIRVMSNNGWLTYLAC